MAHFFLDETLREGDARPGAAITLTGSEARHAVTVSRVRPGERLRVGNGAGLMVTATVTSAAPGELTLGVEEATVTERPAPRIRLVQALAKGDRDERAVQAVTELGADGVVPWAAARSVSRWEGAKAAKGRERWAGIAREATKQSIRAWLPEVSELVTTRQLARLAGDERMLLLEPNATVRLTDALDTPDGTPAPGILLVVGPEGGIAPEELDLLQEAGATPVRLGDTILRTSTAGPAALAVLNQALGRW
ncbi:16S rRNA (uracil(1498)-N(3))-methyltransferase [Cryobacterium tepidiphilum]|uniref:Ribosomal RNA small subunit methyltransferase E n=1 Tax=Cryobacterium tepidiphilum TaxID=2486026 RepID=A0A3M8KZQ9_9MICO|nr:16S rRNA (uracil(1498)-N(3))-methyltransferase [Cryobacterium tepidiphilum]RNE58535.1 16S rRNA (uracil(1498)-N(3))-methyltransferase [Cryobacterium tepidiphilum]